MNLPFELPLETDRLVLRLPRADDVDALMEYSADPEVCRYLPYEPRERDEIEKTMERRLGFTEFTPEGHPLFLHVEIKETGEMIGEFLLFSRDVEARQGEIGYVLNPRFQGKGYALEAATALMDIAFKVGNLHRIEAKCSAPNQPSYKLMEKLGMRREAHFKEQALFKGDWDELLIYAILQREWRELHP
ncbi:GNAT family protein [Maritalea porphyrae]|jgi:RimJ/RimL family protein N-acetyltransferase|uniref:GNAT family N-acetyltransferase n=1 Tax=Maritalea porphyrae TaxID=880732 RepID=UPI0022B05A03|nr:GNAT family protein [Maritalea porphyrae]MCZ4272734.1 GNAT family protein [Maritalea porphyrae]